MKKFFLIFVFILTLTGCWNNIISDEKNSKLHGISGHNKPSFYLEKSQEYLMAGFPQDSEDELKKGLLIYPDSLELHRALARHIINKGIPSHSLATLNKSIALFPQDPELLVLVAKAELSSGNIDKASSILNDKVLSDKNDISSLLYKIEEINNAKIQESAKEYKKLVRIAEDYRKKGVFLKAAEAFERAEKLYDSDFSKSDDIPDREYVLISSAQCYKNIKMANEALMNLKKAKEISPDNIEIKRLLADLYLNRGRPDLSVLEMEDAVKLNQNSIEDRGNLGIYHFKAGNYFKAANELRKVIQIDSRNSAAYYNLALALKEADDLSGALDACKNAIKYSIPGSLILAESEKLLMQINRR